MTGYERIRRSSGSNFIRERRASSGMSDSSQHASYGYTGSSNHGGNYGGGYNSQGSSPYPDLSYSNRVDLLDAFHDAPPPTPPYSGGTDTTQSDTNGLPGRGPISKFTTSVPRGPRQREQDAMFGAVGSVYSGVGGGGRRGSVNRSMFSLGNSGAGPGYTASFGMNASRHGEHRVGSALPMAMTMNGMESSVANEAMLQALRLEASKRKLLLAEKWRRRIKGCCSTGRAAIPVWKYLLNGRRMVLSEREDLDTWLEFASLCRNGGNTALAERVLGMVQRFAVNDQVI